MIKRYALLFLFVLFAAPLLRAQAYYPMLDSLVNEWTYATQMLGVTQQPAGDRTSCTLPFFVMPFSDAREYTAGDTLIDSLTYKIVMHEEYFQPCLFGFMREDTATRRVYFRSHQDTAEYVLYDFSQQPGDTLYFNFPQGPGVFSSGWYTLDSIRTVSITAGTRPAFYYHNPNAAQPFVVIESVGWHGAMNYRETTEMYIGWPFGQCPGYQHQFSQFLICFNHSSHVYFDSCAYTLATQLVGQGVQLTDSCSFSYFSGGIAENNMLRSFTLQPNPAVNRVQLTLELQQQAATTIRISDLTGRLVQQEQFGKLSGGNHTLDLHVENLQPGVYSITCVTGEAAVTRKLIIQR
jgi:hypothetical protein